MLHYLRFSFDFIAIFGYRSCCAISGLWPLLCDDLYKYNTPKISKVDNQFRVTICNKEESSVHLKIVTLHIFPTQKFELSPSKPLGTYRKLPWTGLRKSWVVEMCNVTIFKCTLDFRVHQLDATSSILIVRGMNMNGILSFNKWRLVISPLMKIK